MDGVSFIKHDGVLAFTVYNLVTNLRHLCVVLRKSWMCRCGCAGWCSVFMVLRYLAWALNAAAMDTHPCTNHNGQPWPAGSRRAELAGQAFESQVVFALVQIECDWAEFCHTIGFPTWKSVRTPCFLCHCCAESLYQFVGVSLVRLPWALVSFQDYNDACDICEIKVMLRDKRDHILIKSHLHYPKTKNNPGRCLRADVPEFNLLRSDRLDRYWSNV